MNGQFSSASWKLLADGLDCSLKTFDAAADGVRDKLDCAHDLFAARSTADLVGVWSKHSARQMLTSVVHGQTATELNWKLWVDFASLARASGLLPQPALASAADANRTTLSPDEEVRLLHLLD